MDRYAVIGNPVAHSLSPAIHARFAAQCGERIEYLALLAPLDGFRATVERFFRDGGRGANVTLPFKVEAYELAHEASERAREAGAANFLAARDGRIVADNTDGAGLVADLRDNLGIAIRGARILMLGAGGAARGVVGPLLAQSPARLVIANRDAARARELAQRFAGRGTIEGCGLDAIPGADFDLLLNATSASTLGVPLAVPDALLRPGVVAYDMAYGAAARPFLERARARGARAADGLGMLVEQAAESYRLWRGRRPATAEVLAALRADAA
ncbi:MAG TPA: shikimate dehydrogenase [Usitatibacter sp.]|nr:shikimate dehydrogenase [Usitatibacter sp.]